MPIDVTCLCGARFRAGDKLRGRRVACPKCQTPIHISAEDDLVEVVEESLEVVEDSTSDDDPYGLLDGPDVDPELEYEVHRRRRSHSAQASRPGRLRVDYLHYARCFPKWPAIWLISAVGFGVLGILHWLFFLGVALCLGMLAWCRSRAQGHLLIGDLNPGLVVSESPYHIATLLNLSKGGPSMEIIKVVEQPLQHSPTPVSVGDQVATITTFSALDSNPHWIEVDPIAVPCATRHASEVQRVHAEIEEKEWKLLRVLLKQLPSSPEPGIYRVDRKRHQAPAKRRIPPDRVRELAERHLEPSEIHDCYLVGTGIPPKELAPFAWAKTSGIVALVKTASKEGFCLMPTHVAIKLGDTQVQLRWENIRHATATMDYMEVWCRDGQRHRLEIGAFARFTEGLESIFNEIARECE